MGPSSSARMLIPGLLLVVVGASAADSGAPTGLVGTWRLVSFEDIDNGQTIRRFGK